jgi:16S rRNA G527 N7-methylase RsmG
MARWGVTVTAEEVETVHSPADFDALMARAVERRRQTA